jgi:ABC-2 type transport system permease protein
MAVPERGHHAGLDSAGAPSAAVAADGGAPGYRASSTLPLRVELRRQLTRRRTRYTVAFLVVLPFLLVGAFLLGDDDRGGAPGLVEEATAGAGNFTLFVLFASTSFLLVVVFALFAGDTVASEASWSSLRYLLAAPVPRGQLLGRKLLVALGSSVFALVLLPAVAFLAGGLFFGWEPVRTPLGTSLGGLDLLARLGIAVGYLALTLLFVSALAFCLGVFTDAPLGAVGGAVLIVIVSNILDAVTALGQWREGLPTHYSFAWLDVLAPELAWEQMARGVLLSLTYSLVLLTVAWWRFLTKDVVS